MTKLPWMCTYDDCQAPREGRTEFCAVHNSGLRKMERDLRKEVAKPKLLKRSAVKKVSTKQASINDKLHQVYAELDEAARIGNHIYCSAYPKFHDGIPGIVIDHSHTISRRRCKELGKPELIYDPGNIEHVCRLAHVKWDDYEPEFLRHANFQVRMDYLKIHDPQDWQRRMDIWAKHNPAKSTI